MPFDQWDKRLYALCAFFPTRVEKESACAKEVLMEGDMLDLLDYRRRVAELYQAIRKQGTDTAEAHAVFRQARDELFREHPQSPLDEDQKAAFGGLRYYSYDPGFRVLAEVDSAVEPRVYQLDIGSDGQLPMQQFAQVSFDLPTGSGTLALYWIKGYGGGVFLPFRDETNNRETYGGGRYLFDTIKGADLGAGDGWITLDFNYAYHPSCYYNPRWVCPLAPPQNRLDFAVHAGEMLMDG
jgi:uncharacterized protein (DUF1684 family)